MKISFVNGELTREIVEGADQSVTTAARPATAAVSQAVASRVDNSQTQVAPQPAENQPIALAFYVFGHRDPSANRFLGTDMTRALAQTACYREAPRYEEFLTAAVNESRRQQLPESRIITLARNHGIRQLGIVSMQQVIDSYYISVKIVNVETGETIATAELDNSLASLADIRTASENLVSRFANLCQ